MNEVPMRCFLLATTMLSLGLVPAQALEPSEPARDVIVVTAQKRAQDIQDVPLAITAFDQEGLDRFGIQQFDDLADFVPGLEVQEQSPNKPSFVIRGISSDTGEPNDEMRIAIFQDGVPISRTRGAFVELFDSQVEVVRGPQPTLFGRSALIGAINVTSTKPEIGGTGGKVRAGVGNDQFLFAEGALNLPMGERAAARIAGRFKERDGYVENLIGEDLNGFQTGALRGSVRFQPTDSLDVSLIANYQQDETTGTAFKSGTFLPSDENGVVPEGASIDPWEPASLATIADGRGPNEGQALGVEREIWGITGLIDWDINDVFTLSSITNYREFDNAEVFDADGFALPYLTFAEKSQGDHFFQEVRLGFEELGRFSGFVGASYFDEASFQNIFLFYDERLVVPGFLEFLPNVDSLYSAPRAQVQAPPLLADLPTEFLGTELGLFAEEFTLFGETTSFDVFGDVTASVTDRLKLTAGIRYTYDEKRAGYGAGVFGGTVPGVAVDRPTQPGDASALSPISGVTGCEQGGGTVPVGLALSCIVYDQNVPVFVEDEFDGVTYRVALQYDVTDDITMFVNHGRGRRPEVFDYTLIQADGGVKAERFNTVEAEETDAYEIGVRGSLFDGALSGEVVGYHYEYTNFQTQIIEGGRRFIANAGNASGSGIETALAVRPAPWVTYFFTYAYNGVEFDDEDNNGEPQLRAGNQFRLAPKHALTAAAEFVWDCECGTFSIRPSYSYRSEIFFDDDNDIAYDPSLPSDVPQLQEPSLETGNPEGDLLQNEVQPSYGLVNLQLSYIPKWDDTLEVEAFVRNLFDEDYLLDAGNAGDSFGIPTFVAGPPRMYGFYVSKSF